MPKPRIDYDSPGARAAFLAGVLAGALRELLRQPENAQLRRQALDALTQWDAFTRERRW